MRESMRCLFMPWPVVRDIFKDGNFLICWDLAEELVDHHNCHAYFLVEEPFREVVEKYYPNGRPGITFVYDTEMFQYAVRDRQRFVTPKLLLDMFSRRYGFYQIDFVYITEPEAASLVKSLLSDGSKREQTVQATTVLVREASSVRARTWYTEFIPLLDMPSSLNRAWGYLAGYPLYSTEKGVELHAVEYEQWLNPYAVKELRKRSMVLPHMIARSTYDVPTEKQDDFTIFYGGRLSHDKNVRDMNKILSAVSAQGVNVEMCTSTRVIRNQEIRDFATKFKSNIHFDMRRVDYLKVAGRCHIGLSASEYESFGTAYLEQTALRCPTVLLKAPWTEEVYPEWYPWFYKTNEEAVSLILKIKDTYHTKAFQKQLDEVCGWMRERFHYEPIVKQLLGFIDKIQTVEGYEESFYTPPEAQLLAIARAVELFRGKQMTIHALTRLIPRFHKFFKPNRIARGSDRLIACDYDIYRILMLWGLKDNTKSPVSSFYVPDNWTAPSEIYG